MDKAAKLRELHELKNNNILSEEEFTAEKKKLLDEGDSPNIPIPPSSEMAPINPPLMPPINPPLTPPPQQGSGAGKIVAIIAVVLVVIVVIGIIISAVMYVWAASFLEQGESAPIATFRVEESSSGIYYVAVIKVSKQEDLAGFSYFLKEPDGYTYVGGNGFGEVAMQSISGELHGIDTSYTGSDTQLQHRADNVTNDDGSNYPVHFSDKDRDGKLSAGDEFEVYGQGNAANGPAGDNWKLDIQFDASGDIIGTAKML
jgi:hypothetical protein